MTKERLSMRERKKRETRANILRVSRRLFEKNGTENTSLDEIAEKADISKPTFFNYFTSKDNLIISIAEEEVADVLDYVEEELKPVKSSLEKAKLILKRLVEDGVKYPHLTGKLIYATSIINSECPSTIYKTYTQLWVDLFREAQTAGEISPDFSAEELTLAMQGYYYGVMFKCLETGETAEAVSDMNRLTDLLFRAAGKHPEDHSD